MEDEGKEKREIVYKMQNKNRKREEMLQTGYGGQYGVGMTATGATVVIKSVSKH